MGTVGRETGSAITCVARLEGRMEGRGSEEAAGGGVRGIGAGPWRTTRRRSSWSRATPTPTTTGPFPRPSLTPATGGLGSWG